MVLAGGRGSRLGGVDKASVVVDGRTLLDHVLDAVALAELIVVVGPRKADVPGVTWAREDPPGGGPREPPHFRVRCAGDRPSAPRSAPPALPSAGG